MKLLLIAIILGIGASCIFYLDSVMQPPEKIEHVQIIEEYIEEMEEPETVSLGEFEITHYCTCPVCCGKWSDGITASGEKAEPGSTVATDPSVIPTGTVIIIDGHEYIAQDTGSAIIGNRLDILTDSHEVAIARGIKRSEVFTVVEKTIY